LLSERVRPVELANDGDSDVRELEAVGELRDEGARELAFELVLEDGGGDGDAPCLEEGARECEKGECRGGAVRWERGEDWEDRGSKLSEIVVSRGSAGSLGTGYVPTFPYRRR
jgi:hypothetical protein